MMSLPPENPLPAKERSVCSAAKCHDNEAASATARSYFSPVIAPGPGLSKTTRNLRSSSRVNSRTLSDPDFAVDFQGLMKSALVACVKRDIKLSGRLPRGEPAPASGAGKLPRTIYSATSARLTLA